MSAKLKPALQFSQGRSLPWSGSRLLNCFAEKSDGDQRDDFAVMLIPGLELFATLSNEPVRGMLPMGDLLYVVCGPVLYSVTQSGVVTVVGGVSDGPNTVSMATNGTQLAICASLKGFVYSVGSMTEVTSLPAVSDVTCLDSYMIWSASASNQFVISQLNDALTYDPLDIASVEGEPSHIRGIVNDHRELQFYKGKSVEIWYNSGAADFTFERQGNAFIERGCFDRDSIVKIDNSTHFVGDNLIVYRLDGYTPTRISTHAIEYQLRNVTYARAFTYVQEGHTFYCLGTDNGTFCYDMATGAWHERQSFGLTTWRAVGAVSIWNGTVIADGTTGKLYRPSMDSYTENGDPISMQIDLPTIEAGDRRRVTMSEFELLCETGVGLTTGQGSDPQALLTYSDDGGRNWSLELSRSLGAIGAYSTRAVWRRLGQFRQRQIRLVITDPVRRLVMSYFAGIS